MKKICMILIIFLAFGTTASKVSASTVLKLPSAGNLAAYWTFDSRTLNWGTNKASDSSGNGNTGTLTNLTSASSIAGKLGQALLFDGNVASVVLASNPISAVSNPSSICVWANTADITSHAGGWNQTFLNLFTDTNNGIRMESVYPTGALAVSYRMGGAYYGAQSTSQVFANNAWVHICYVWNGVGIALYANGSSLATTSLTDSIGTVSILGARDDGGDGAWDGPLDDIRVYSRALSAQEVVNIYKSGAATIDVGLSGDLSGGLVGWWTFDGRNIGNIAADSSGQRNDGKITNMSTTTAATPGKIGQGLTFNGGSNYVNVGGNSSVLNLTGNFSMSVWFRTATTNTLMLVNKTSGPASNGYEIYTQNGNIYSRINSNNGTQNVSPLTYNDNKWHHATITFDGTTHALYIDGIQVISHSDSAPVSNTSAPLEIGARVGALNFSGTLDDVRIYNRALSAAEVKQLYQLGAATIDTASPTFMNNGLIGYWSMDGKTTDWKKNQVADLSGQGNTGTMVSMSTTTSPVIGKIGQGLQFDGAASYVNPGALAGFGTSISAAAWVKPGSTAVMSVLGAVRTVSSRSGFMVFLNTADDGATNTSGSVYVKLLSNHAPVSTFTLSGATDAANVPQNVWTHVAVVVTPASNSIAVYVNGIPQSVTYNLQQTPAAYSTANPFLAIGALASINATTISTGSFYQGSLDDVRIYNRALSQTEVTALYNMGK